MKKTLRKIAKSKKIFALIGDFNINLLEYSNHLPTSKYYDQVSSSGFRPLILQPTRVSNRSATLIDNIFLNDLSCTSKGGNIITSISDHFMQFCYLDIYANANNKVKNLKSSRNWRIFNKREFESELSQIDWNSKISPSLDVNKSSQIFYETITQLLNEMAPFKKLTKKEFSLKKSPWITSGILKSMKIRDRLYKGFVLEKNHPQKEQIFQKYKKYRNMILTLTRKSKKVYYSNYFSQHNSNIKKNWEGIRELVNMNKKKSNNVRMIFENNKHITNNKDMANSFNDFYSNVGKNIEQKIPKTNTHFSSFLNFTINSKFSFTPCSKAEIKSIILEFGNNKACGPNSIPTNLLKEFIELFAYPIKLLVNKSLKDGIFPDIFKIAHVCPVYKKSDKAKCANYRPISLLSNLSKVFEKIMYKQLEKYLETNNLICDHQFGFRKNHSTEHALMSISEQIKEIFEKNCLLVVFLLT